MATKRNDKQDLNGFVKIDRGILEWEWWDDLNTFRLFMTILLLANWKDKKWRGRTIKRGSLWTSLPSLSAESQLTIQQVRNSLNKLKSTGEITDKPTASGRIITVVKYDVYQDNKKKRTDKSTGKPTDKEQTNEQANNRQPNRRATATEEVLRSNKEVIEQQEDVVHTTTIDLTELLSVDEVIKLSQTYKNHGSLIEAVEDEVNRTGRIVAYPYNYVDGYAKKVGWPTK